MPGSDLRKRLNALRPQKKTPPQPETPTPVPPRLAPNPKTSHSVRSYDPDEGQQLPGVEARNNQGGYQLIEERYPLDRVHGSLSFGDLLNRSPHIAARLARQPALAQASLRDLAFIDTETTGLAGGAGTLAFLIGVGVFEDDAFVVRQLFLRDPSEEMAALIALEGLLARRAGWVTFNGRAFDVPLLETRYTLNRRRAPFAGRPHFDLLNPARWLYRGRLASCALSSLEANVLGVPRTTDDVPGALIPWMYVQFLRSGDATEMRRVIYHNAMDILSMVTLAAHLLDVFDHDRVEAEAEGARSPEDWLRLAHWHEADQRLLEAEAAYRRALTGRLSLEDRAAALEKLGFLLKRTGRRAEAVPLWEQWASFTVDEALPCVELSKYYEWKAQDTALALRWAERAQAIVMSQPPTWQRAEVIDAVTRRLARLQEKQQPPAA
jgi:uncharacterized protein YprB with RNaseH-like and TPR domain